MLFTQLKTRNQFGSGTYTVVVCALGVLPYQLSVKGVQLSVHLAHQRHVAQQSRILSPDNVRFHPKRDRRFRGRESECVAIYILIC